MRTREEKLEYLREWRKRNPDYERQRRVKNPEYFKQKSRRWQETRGKEYRARTKVGRDEYNRKWYLMNKDRSWKKTRASRYGQLGITVADYERMHSAQEGKCAVCQERHDSGRITRRLNVDHCHQTNVVRGLLCTNCNTKLGWYEKHASVIAKYLKSRQQ